MVDKIKNLGAMAQAVALELFCGSVLGAVDWRNNRKKLREFVEKEHMLWYSR